MEAIIDMMFFSGISYLMYCILPNRKMPFRFRRMYLLTAAFMSCIVPFIHIPITTGSIPELAGLLTYNGTISPETTALLWKIYISVVIVLAVSLAVQIALFRIKGRRHTVHEYEYEGFRIKELDNKDTSAYSFINTIHVSASLPSAEKGMILKHEASHLKHLHTWEKLFMHMLKVIMWFNPFIHLMEIHLDEVQECEADCDVLRSGVDKKSYVSLILDQILARSPSFTSEFHNSLTRRRFEAMLNPPEECNAWRSVWLALPMLMAVFTLEFSEAAEPKEALKVPQFHQETVMHSDTAGSKLIIRGDKESRQKGQKTKINPDEEIILITK